MRLVRWTCKRLELGTGRWPVNTGTTARNKKTREVMTMMMMIMKQDMETDNVINVSTTVGIYLSYKLFQKVRGCSTVKDALLSFLYILIIYKRRYSGELSLPMGVISLRCIPGIPGGQSWTWVGRCCCSRVLVLQKWSCWYHRVESTSLLPHVPAAAVADIDADDGARRWCRMLRLLVALFHRRYRRNRRPKRRPRLRSAENHSPARLTPFAGNWN